MNKQQIQIAASQWLACVEQNRAVNGIRNTYPEITASEAYGVQIEAANALRKKGVPIIGKKIAFTRAEQRKKSNFPDAAYGFLRNDKIYNNGVKFTLSNFTQKLEPELAFVLGTDISKNIELCQLSEHIEAVMPAFEIVESRMSPKDFCYENFIASNASFGGAVLGDQIVMPKDRDFSSLHMQLFKNGALLAEAESSVIMGNPLNSVAWLINKTLENGDLLRKGDIILSGSFLPTIPLEAGVVYEAVFDTIGKVCLNIPARTL